MTSPLRSFLPLALSLAILAGCRPPAESAGEAERSAANRLEGRLLLSGSSTVAPLVSEIAARFEAMHPGVRIDIQTGGSGKGIADVRSGQADIGMTSRPLKEDEKDLVAHRLATDGVALIVHASNPIPELTRQQVIDIYTGAIDDWSRLGGAALPIQVVHKAEGRATLEVFLAHFEIDNTAIHPDVIVGENAQAILAVAGSPGAIGYVSIGSAETEARLGAAIRLLPLDGIPATSDEVAAERFPMSRPLNLVVASEPSPLALAFIDYARSEAVHDLVREAYFVPSTR